MKKKLLRVICNFKKILYFCTLKLAEKYHYYFESKL